MIERRIGELTPRTDGLTRTRGAASGAGQRYIGSSVSCVGTEHCTPWGWYDDTSGFIRAEAASTG